MILQLRKRLFSAESIGLALVLTALWTFIYGIASSLKNTDTRYFFWACLIALLLAFSLEKFNSKPILASAGIVAIGAIGDWILGARLAIPLAKLIDAIIQTVPQIIPAIRFKTIIDVTAIMDSWEVIAQASSALAVRFQAWLVGLQQQVFVNDSLVRNMIWLFILWLLAAWMGWFSARRNAIKALIPFVLLLAYTTSYSEFRVETIGILIVVMLLLMGVWNYKNHTYQWEKHKIDYSDSIRYDNIQAVVLLAIAIGFVAFITPSVSWREIRDYLRERNQAQNQLANAMGVKEQPAVPKHIATQQPSLPRDHLLTGGYATSQKIVMTVRTGELPPISDLSLIGASAPRYYWRSVIYDTYVDAGWITSNAPSQSYSANTPLIPGLLNGYKPLHLDVRLIEPEGKLFWSGTLFSADVPLKVDWRVKPTSNLFADKSTLLQADMFAAITGARNYTAESYVPVATIQDLRDASTDYPEEILKKYLQLPNDVPERVLQLAHEITTKASNPYDKAKAIETYLRTNYPYDLDIPTPPSDQDVADYFLFDLKRGYCDYYATAMVVLARANGLPARFVSGYSSGSYDAPNAQYIVREMNAHSWAEVYFPEIGWIEFEPTAAQPEIDRAETNATDPVQQGTDTTASNQLFRLRFERIGYIVFPIVGITIIALLYFTVIERWWYLSMAPASAIERIYQNFYKRGRPLAGERGQAETPHEFMHKVIKRFGDLKEGSRISKIIISPQTDAKQLTNIYQASLFSENQINKNDIKHSLRSWKRLRRQLFLGKIASHKIFSHRP